MSAILVKINLCLMVINVYKIKRLITKRILNKGRTLKSWKIVLTTLTECVIILSEVRVSEYN